jgi:hypothetical protein
MPNIKMGDHILQHCRTIEVNLCYPRSEDQFNAVEVGLCDTRAADNIRITYDFDRDGWSISQASIFEWDSDDEVCDPDWQEVCFIQA